MAAGFQNVVEADDVAFNIYVRMIDTVTYTCLGSQIDDDIKRVFSEQIINKLKDAVSLHRAGAEPNDDLTLLCLSVKKL